MAIRPEISLHARAPDVSQIFNAIMEAPRLKRERDRAPIQNRLLESQATQAEMGVDQQRSLGRATDIAFGAAEILPNLQNGNFDAAARQLTARGERLVAEGKPTETNDEAIQLLSSNPQALLDNVNQIVSTAQQQGIFKGGQTARQKEFTGLTQGLSEEDAASARRIKLGLDPRAIGSSSQTISNLGTAEDVGASEAIIAGAKKEASETAKQQVQLKFKPKIARAVKLAQAEASARGEALTDLVRMRAAMPGLEDAVGQLRELSSIATSTFGGKLFDTAVKETGFGATKGSTAKAKFIAIINNQVLPLLKPTFGGAFSLEEGKSLRDTMGDPNASPGEKVAQIDAFIAQKIRDVEGKERELGIAPGSTPTPTPTPAPSQQQGGALNFDALGNPIQ